LAARLQFPGCMIPDNVIRYLRDEGVPFIRHWHARAVPAQELAAVVGVTGYRVAKAVVVEVDGQIWLAVVPAPELVHAPRLAQVLGAREVHLAEEARFASLFPGCEPGAEPPFGRLFGLPLVVDHRLASEPRIVFRAGSHEETIEMRWADFERLERPQIADFGVVYRGLERLGGRRPVPRASA
jgi:Ala-tRNA(Pro) deacylase